MFHHLETLLISYAESVPLLVFAPLASFTEELIAPIPSGPVMVGMGSLAAVQGYSLPFLFAIAVVAALGKLAGSLVVYAIADKVEDVFAARLAGFLGIRPEQIERFGARFGNGWKDYALLTLLRSLPFVPSAVISAGSGIIKLPLRLFIVATLAGSIIRDAVFLYAGYAGLAMAGPLLERFSALESFVLAGIVTTVLCGGIGLYLYQRTRSRR